MIPTIAPSYLERTARRRVRDLVDAGSLSEYLPPTARRISPNLDAFGQVPAFDDGVLVATARLDGRPVALFAQEGGFLGGAFGEVHAAKIVGLLRRAERDRPAAVIGLFDSGGVRLQEANVGEIGVSEILRALLDVRAAGVPVIGVVAGGCGAFGGAGILTGCCDHLIVSEEGRIGVSGPEVIETVMGVESFDSRDRALVWRTTGGKNRYLFGIAQTLVDDDLDAIRAALAAALATPARHDPATVGADLDRLAGRLATFGDCTDGRQVWARMGLADPDSVPEMPCADLVARAASLTPPPPAEPPAAAPAAPPPDLAALADRLFPDGHDLVATGSVVTGTGTVAGRTVAVAGTAGPKALIGLEEALATARFVLDTVADHPGRPLVMLVDNEGQRMGLREELLGLSQYLALCARAWDVASRAGHPVVAVIHGSAIAGGFIATGMNADRICALPTAKPSVMALEAIARVTHMPLARLQELSRSVPTFAPGLDNLVRLGGVTDPWPDNGGADHLAAVLAELDGQAGQGRRPEDRRARLGADRGGRPGFQAVIDDVLAG